ncbi:MAG: LytTR family DNA-binding domain-containing protein [Arenimonas sp.]
MTSTPHDYSQLLARYLPYRRYCEIGFWVLNYLLASSINSIIVSMDIDRANLDFESWKPVVWETSSNLMLLLLVPAVIYFERRVPLYIGVFRKHLPWHVLASLVFCLLHVSGMVAIRKLIYMNQGEHYDFGNWPLELGYEYLKDWQTYSGILFTVFLYRLLLLRLQGEASLLDAPEDGPELEPVERPERFLVRKLGKEFLISAAEVEYLQASGNYVNLHLHSRDYPLRTTMAAIEPRMDPNKFVRVHRSYMVNLNFIKEMEPLDTGDARILMKDGSLIPCSRRYRAALKAV